MKRIKNSTRNKYLLFLIILGLIFLINSTNVLSYEINWFSIDNGGGYSISSGNEFSVNGTIGQPDTSIQSGGIYSLTGGFWSYQDSATPQLTPDLWMLY